VPRVELSGTGVDKIVLNEERVPSVDEINRGVIPDLNVTIQSKEPLERAIDGIVECIRINAVVPGRPKEKLVVVRGDVDRALQTRGSLIWLSATTTEADAMSMYVISRTKRPQSHI
jgi:hypothetical protein